MRPWTRRWNRHVTARTCHQHALRRPASPSLVHERPDRTAYFETGSNGEPLLSNTETTTPVCRLQGVKVSVYDIWPGIALSYPTATVLGHLRTARSVPQKGVDHLGQMRGVFGKELCILADHFAVEFCRQRESGGAGSESLQERRVRAAGGVAVEVHATVRPELIEQVLIAHMPQPPDGSTLVELLEASLDGCVIIRRSYDHRRHPMREHVECIQRQLYVVLRYEARHDKRIRAWLKTQRLHAIGVYTLQYRCPVGDEGRRYSKLLLPNISDGLRVCDQRVGKARRRLRAGKEHSPRGPTPLTTLPLDAICVDDGGRSGSPESRQEETVGNIQDQGGIESS